MRIIFIYFILCAFFCSCSSKTEKKDIEKTSVKSNSVEYSIESESISEDELTFENENNEDENNGCKYEDGTHSATVYYNNSETGYSQTYTLDIEVQDCQVVQINFSNDGYLDEDHISPADIDENGNAFVYGEDGKTYEIHID